LVDALPKAKISWYLNEKELTAKDGFKFETNAQTSVNSLVLAKVTSTHFGKYTIKASNSVGEIEHSFNVDVLGKKMIREHFSKKYFFYKNTFHFKKHQKSLENWKM